MVLQPSKKTIKRRNPTIEEVPTTTAGAELPAADVGATAAGAGATAAGAGATAAGAGATAAGAGATTAGAINVGAGVTSAVAGLTTAPRAMAGATDMTQARTGSGQVEFVPSKPRRSERLNLLSGPGVAPPDNGFAQPVVAVGQTTQGSISTAQKSTSSSRTNRFVLSPQENPRSGILSSVMTNIQPPRMQDTAHTNRMRPAFTRAHPPFGAQMGNPIASTSKTASSSRVHRAAKQRSESAVRKRGAVSRKPTKSAFGGRASSSAHQKVLFSNDELRKLLIYNLTVPET